jgi:hypothetical protein
MNVNAPITAPSDGSAPRPWHRALVRRSAVALCGVVLTGGLAAGCGGGTAAPSPSTSHVAKGPAATTTASVTHSTATTTTAAAQCGAPRDPLDPTNTPGPNPPRC